MSIQYLLETCENPRGSSCPFSINGLDKLILITSPSNLARTLNDKLVYAHNARFDRQAFFFIFSFAYRRDLLNRTSS